MSYKTLYRSYRPKTFKDVVGQEHITSTLKNTILNNKVGHAYLFAGPRGTGKTSVAHVFAKAVNVNAAGQEVIGDMDIIEIDAASNNGVSEVRTIIDNVNYAPTRSKYKVYIIDEVHMLTKGAFNALLKTLEEPPAHVIFILATTEPHKIPITILSRTQRFNFRRIDEETIGKRLIEVLNNEQIKYDSETIRFISKLAQGGMRDALSIADQSASFGNGEISFDTISQVFGIISIANQIRLLNLAYSNNSIELMKLTSKLLDNGADIERLSISLLDILKDFIIIKKTEDPSLIKFISEDEVKNLNVDVPYAYEAIDILIKLLSDIKFSSSPRQSFELAILKLINENSFTEVDKNVDEIIVKREQTFEATVDQETTMDQPKIKEEINEEIVELKTSKDEVNIEVKEEHSLFAEKKIDEVISRQEEILETEDAELRMDIFEKTVEIPKEPVMERENQNNLFDVINEEKQIIEDNSMLEDHVLSTQEININNVNSKIDNEEISEDNIMRFFETDDEEDNVQESVPKRNVDKIINMLVQADRSIISEAKEKWLKLQEFANSKNSSYIRLLEKTKPVSAGEKFILIA